MNANMEAIAAELSERINLNEIGKRQMMVVARAVQVADCDDAIDTALVAQMANLLHLVDALGWDVGYIIQRATEVYENDKG